MEGGLVLAGDPVGEYGVPTGELPVVQVRRIAHGQPALAVQVEADAAVQVGLTGHVMEDETRGPPVHGLPVGEGTINANGYRQQARHVEVRRVLFFDFAVKLF